MSQFVRTFKRRKLFLDQLAVGSSISFAAQAAGGTTQNFRRWRETDPDFAADWDDAIEQGTDYIEDIATERAMKKSDPLMAMILKARRPEKYDRGGKLELSGQINVEGSKAKLLNRIARLQAAGQVLGGSGEEGTPLPAPSDGSEPEDSQPLLPPPGSVPERGRKRRAVAGGNRREAAS